MSLNINNIDNRLVAIGDNNYQTDVWAASGAKTLAKGTILALSTANGKFIEFEKGGSTNGNGVPAAVLENEVSATGAGDVAIRPIISGLVNFEKLVIDADGDNSNIDNAVIFDLKSQSIVTIKTSELNELDNQ